MITEDGLSTILNINILRQDQFHLQLPTIITWKEDNDYHNSHILEDNRAISFQELEGLQEIWALISQIQGTSPTIKSEDKYFFKEESNDNEYVFPEITIDNIKNILDIINHELNTDDREKINNSIIKSSYSILKQLKKLIQNEDNNLINNKHIFIKDYVLSIVQRLLQIGDCNLIEQLLEDNYYPITLQSLIVNDDSLSTISHSLMVEFPDSTVLFELQDILEENVYNSMRLMYRLLYVQEISLKNHYVINNEVFNVILYTHLSHVIFNQKTLGNIIFTISNNNDYDLISKCCVFILEIENFITNVPQLKIQFNENLIHLKILNAFDQMLSNCNSSLKKAIKMNVIKILVYLIASAPQSFKEYFTCKNMKSFLIDLIPDIIILSSDYSIKSELAQIIKNLVDNTLYFLNTKETISDDLNMKIKNSFVYPYVVNQLPFNNNKLSYVIPDNQIINILNKCILPLIIELTTPIKENKPYFNTTQKQDEIKAITYTKQITLELVVFCLNVIKSDLLYEWLNDNNSNKCILDKIISTYTDTNKILHSLLISFIKSMLCHSNENIVVMILDEKYLHVIPKLFNIYSNKANLIWSSLRSLFNSITISQHRKTIVSFFCKKYSNLIYNLKHRHIFDNVIAVYEEQNDSLFGISSPKQEDVANLLAKNKSIFTEVFNIKNTQLLKKKRAIPDTQIKTIERCINNTPRNKEENNISNSLYKYIL